MVAGGEHREPGHARIHQRQRAHRAPLRQPPQDKRAPRRPGHVQGRHRRELVRVRRQRAAVEVGAERGRGGDHVGEAGQHPRRCDRAAPEHHEADHVHEHERVAKRPVQIPASPPQPSQQPQREPPVGVVVVVRQDRAERVMMGKPAVERQLGVQVQRLLEVQHPARVGERGVIASYTHASHAIVSSSAHQRGRRRVGAVAPGRACAREPPRLVGIATDKYAILSAAPENRSKRLPRYAATARRPRCASVSMICGSAAAVRRHEPAAP